MTYIKGDLIIVKRDGHECRAIIDHVWTGDDDETVERYAIRVGYGTLAVAKTARYPRPMFYDLGEEADVQPSEIVRKVTLKDRIDGDPVEFASDAAQWMRATQPAEDAIANVCYMLAGKLHKFAAEAWLGGCDGLEQGANNA